ncbi:MAG: LutC/YkgG family protein [Terriglobia bacterium]
MATREEMMARITVALGGSPGNRLGRPQLDPSRFPELGQVMPSIGPEELIPKFMSEFERVSTKVWRARNFADLDAILADLVKGATAGSAVISRNPLLKKVNLADRLKTLGVNALVWPESAVSPEAERLFREGCFAAPIGFTGADFALAETGSLVVSSLTEGAQLASLAPPVHVALVLESQVVASLEEALAGIAISRDSQSPSPGRSVVFITGTSRTADIEQIVVRGVHGPQQVHAILIEDACLAQPS